MTTPYPDQSSQYTPGTGGGQARRRMRRGWRITLVIIAVLVAVAIGAGVALALGHHGPGTAAGKNPTPPAHFDSVDALNNPSSVVPAGWVTRTLKSSADHTTAGFTIDMPRGWTEQPVGDATYFYGPSHMFLDIDLTRHKYPDDMVQEAKNIEKGALEAGKFPLYKLAYLQAVTVRGTKGAIWQFTWLLDGVRLRADDILFVMPTPAGAQSYGVYIRGPNSGWSAKYLPIFDEILRTFQTVPASA